MENHSTNRNSRLNYGDKYTVVLYRLQRKTYALICIYVQKYCVNIWNVHLIFGKLYNKHTFKLSKCVSRGHCLRVTSRRSEYWRLKMYENVFPTSFIVTSLSCKHHVCLKLSRTRHFQLCYYFMFIWKLTIWNELSLRLLYADRTVLWKTQFSTEANREIIQN